MKTVTAKPFSRDFDEQLDAAESICGRSVKLRFQINDALEILEEFRGVYSDAILARVEETLRMQRWKYRYLF